MPRWLENRALKAQAAAERRNRAHVERQPLRWTAGDTVSTLVCATIWTVLPVQVFVGCLATVIVVRLWRRRMSSRCDRAGGTEVDEVETHRS